MRQKLIQSRQSRQKLSTRKLTIHDISPEWARLLARLPRTETAEFYIRGQKMDIQDCKFCVVGEAHGFSKGYGDRDKKDFCYDCYACSVNFAGVLLMKPQKRMELIEPFVSHWNESHV